MEIQGKFDAQRFFDTLARILSEREKVDITVKVTRREEKEEEAEEGRQKAPCRRNLQGASELKT